MQNYSQIPLNQFLDLGVNQVEPQKLSFFDYLARKFQGQQTGAAAPVNYQPITQAQINAAYNQRINNPNLATNGKTLRELYYEKLGNNEGYIPSNAMYDPELIKKMIQSGMFR